MKILRLLVCLVWLGVWGVPALSAAPLSAPPGSVSGQADCGGDLTPADRMNCENVQLDAADEALNRVYRALMQLLDKDAKAMLLDGQRGWLKYRDRNFELFSSAASTGGQQGMAEQLHFLRTVTVARVRELENLYRLFQESGLLKVPGQGEAVPPTAPPGSGPMPAAAPDAGTAPPSPIVPPGPEADQASALADQVPPGDEGHGDIRTEIKDQAGLEKLLGRHLLRLQWLSGELPGEAVIENRNGVYWLNGVQGSGGNQLLIKGWISTVRADNFTFHGTVTTTLDFLNEGKPCVRSGQMWFVRKDGRPFWRLQSINSPCSGVSDYIDLYVDSPAQW